MAACFEKEGLLAKAIRRSMEGLETPVEDNFFVILLFILKTRKFQVIKSIVSFTLTRRLSKTFCETV